MPVFTLTEPYRARMLAWIEALESDEYQQGEGRLEARLPGSLDRPRHCCLGVLCRVSQLNGLDLETSVVTTQMGLVTRFGSEGNRSTPPVEVVEWIMGPPSLQRDHFVLALEAALIRMNDNRGNTFKEIALFLRDQYSLVGESSNG